MSEFRIFETDEFLKQLKEIPKKDRAFLERKLKDYVYPQIRREPFAGPNIKKLRGYVPETWRYRMGRFRLFYVPDAGRGILFVVTVDLRRDAYR